MQLIRFGEPGKEKPGLLKQGQIIDLRSVLPDIPDINPTFFEENWLEKIAQITFANFIPEARLGPPVICPSKIICLGKNYADHAAEGGFKVPAKPLLFCKTPNTLTGCRDPIFLPHSSSQVDWEVELAVIMGKQARSISRQKALEYVAGFCVMNDVSAREAQFADGQWFRGKSFDSFAPLGPALVTLDEIPGYTNLKLTTRVNGHLMQTGRTSDLIFDIPAIIEYISADITLMPGDIISTGTPSGVGFFRDPPITLKPGDVVECRIESIGRLVNQVLEKNKNHVEI